MTAHPESARAALLGLVQRGLSYTYQVPPPHPDSSGVRHSAVLVLFGVLDSVPSTAPENAAVHADLDVLLTRRADTMRHHPGQIAFPGGGREAEDASPADTALREAREETGLDPSGVEILGELPPYYVAVSNNLVTPVIGWWHSPSDVVADQTESLEVFRVPVSELLRPQSRGTGVLTAGAARFRADAFRLGPQFRESIVWGFTGILLSSVFEALEWSEPWDRTVEIPVTRL